MRIGYSEDEEFGGQFALWQANCQRSLHGKAGQAALRELETALLALPEKRLIANALQDDQGNVCAVGALAKHKGHDMKVPVSEYDPDFDEPYMEDLGVALGMPRLVAWKVVCMNDVEISGQRLVNLPGPYRWPAERPFVWESLTPEQRYEQMLAWVQRQLLPPASEDIVGVRV